MRRLIWATFLSLACAHIAWAETPRPETLDDTLMLMRDQFIADPRVSSTKIDTEQRYISFTLGDGPLQISLPDTVHETLQNAADDGARETALLQFIDFTISASQSVAPEAPIDLTRIYPVIRPIGFGRDPIAFDFSRRAVPEIDDEEEFSAPVSLPFTADMEVFFVQDSDQVIEFVTASHLEQLGISATELLKVAKNNLGHRDWNLEIAGGEGLYIIALNGDFETSFMLNKAFWQGVDVGLGSVVAVVAARDLVLFVDGDEDGAIENLRTLVDPTINDFPEAISTVPLKWENGAWQPLN